jgi:hypothetical protein
MPQQLCRQEGKVSAQCSVAVHSIVNVHENDGAGDRTEWQNPAVTGQEGSLVEAAGCSFA